MATGDMVARLVLDGEEFELSLKKAKKGVKDFEEATKKAGSKGVTPLEDSLGKMGEKIKSIGAVFLGYKAASGVFSEVLKMNQEYTDGFGRTIEKVKVSWDYLKASLLGEEMTRFADGIDRAAERAAELYDALDKLANVGFSANFRDVLDTRDFKKAITDARNKDLSIAERRAAEELEEMKQTNAIYKEATEKAIMNRMSSLTGLDVDEFTLDIIENAFSLDVRPYSEERRKLAKQNFNKYKTEQEKAWKEWQDLEGYNQKHVNEAAIEYGYKNAKEFKEREPEAYEREVNRFWDHYQNELNRLQEKYKEDIIIYTALFKETDEQLQKDMKLFLTYVTAGDAITEKENTLNELRRAINTEDEALAAQAKKYAEVLKSMPWDAEAVSAMRLNAALTGNFTAENIARMGSAPGLRSSLDLGVPGLPEYGGEYGFWKFNTNPIKSSGALEAMGVQTFDWEAMQQLIADDELKAWAAKNREEFDKWGASIDLLGGAFKSLGDSIGGTTGQLLSFIGGLVDAAQQMLPFIAQIMAETAAREANASAAATEAAAKSMSAYAGIPFAGIGLGLAAVAAVVGAIQSVPKFAEGGIVTSATLGVFGEAGPEAVMPLDRLEEFVTGRDVRVTGNIKASGKELVVVLDNYNRVRNG